ncbi:aminotransferase DegT [Gammaproteobacteria bacterium 45_16_T64]|nr:aminotransferase DegT [Gammaproteobacteria bacterium 45_16_T64]
MNFIDLGAQYLTLKKRIDNRIQEVLDHGQYIMGPEVFDLELKLAEYVGVKHCISCGNGTDALQLSLMALGVSSGDAVFCPTFSFFASAEVIPLTGSTPKFVDVDPGTFNIDPGNLEKQIEECISEGILTPKAIIAVNLFGLPANYPQIKKIAQKHGLLLIEDAAQGFGGKIDKHQACSFGDLSTTSFFPAKPLGCYGDGGAIFTNNDKYAERLNSLRSHGKGENKYDNIRIGMNSRLDTIQAAILLEKFSVFPNELESREEIARSYTAAFKDIASTPTFDNAYFSSWAQYTLKVNNRNAIISELSKKGIPTSIYYQTCIHSQTAFGNTYLEKDLPVAKMLSSSVLSLPIHPYLKEKEQQLIIRQVRNVLKQFPQNPELGVKT